MRYRIYLSIFLFLTVIEFSNGQALPGENGNMPGVESSWFPSRQHAFVFRNWTLVPVDRLAKVLETSVENVSAMATSMGLPAQENIEPQWNSSKGYITVLRSNWNLLNYDQLITLLGITRPELAWRLKEDDFLYVKLGNLKPFCTPLIYEAPTKEIGAKALQISKWVKEIGNLAFAPEKPRFSFLNDFPKQVNEKEIPDHPILNNGTDYTGFRLRMVSSYCAEFGDPLMDKDLGSFPEGLLYKLAKVGVNAIWLHTVLNTLVAPDGDFPGSADAPKRIEGLKNLVKRASKFGIGIYLYMNEPRGLETRFFESSEKRKSLEGVKETDYAALCTTVPEVREWLTNSLKTVFQDVPNLAGIFTITGSENLTSCISHGKQKECGRCKDRAYSDIMVELISAMEKGVKSGNPKANVIVWDWGWDDRFAETIIKGIPKSCWLMSVSEWSLPIVRGGIQSSVGEYSISSVGPGPRALDHWKTAREAGLKTVAKVQVNCTWEMSIVPALPTMDLVAQHAENLSKESVTGVMLSWSLGGYPSANIDLFQSWKTGKMEENLNALSKKYYGEKATPFVRKAWTQFSEAFREYPYHISTVYQGPQQVGPANPFYIQPTGMISTMVGFPYDDLSHWKAVYPEKIWADQMAKVAEGFEKGCKTLKDGLKQPGIGDQKALRVELDRATAVAIHFSSVANQARFIMARDRFYASKDPKEKQEWIGKMRGITREEIRLVKRMIPILKKDPYIAFESSNHYYYVPQYLLEKYINLKNVLEQLNR